MKVTILKNREVKPLHFHLVVALPSSSPLPFTPGQFAMIGFGVLDPFLPRAFSIYRVSHQPSAISRQQRQKAEGEAANTEMEDGGITRLEFLYKVMGKGSAHLSTLKSGQALEMLVPLGKGFTVPEGLETAILVAGGIGVPPIVALAESIQDVRCRMSDGRIQCPTSSIQHPTPPKMVAFVGGKSREDVLCVRDFKRAGAEVHVATEDGSTGRKGLITDLLEQYLRATSYKRPAVVYACGPTAMLAAVADVAAKYGLPCQVSTEATMACGFGICMGCAIPVKPSAIGHRPASYKLCCKDGPVFDAQEIVW